MSMSQPMDLDILGLEILRSQHYQHRRDKYKSPDCSQCSGGDGYHFLFDNGDADIAADEERVKKLEARIRAPLRA